MIQDRPAMVPPAPSPGKLQPNPAATQRLQVAGPTQSMAPREMNSIARNDQAAASSRAGFDRQAQQILGPQEAQRISGLRQKVLQRNSDYGWTDTA